MSILETAAQKFNQLPVAAQAAAIGGATFFGTDLLIWAPLAAAIGVAAGVLTYKAKKPE